MKNLIEALAVAVLMTVMVAFRIVSEIIRTLFGHLPSPGRDCLVHQCDRRNSRPR
jgi:hypothetical protein